MENHIDIKSYSLFFLQRLSGRPPSRIGLRGKRFAVFIARWLLERYTKSSKTEDKPIYKGIDASKGNPGTRDDFKAAFKPRRLTDEVPRTSVLWPHQ